MIEAKKKKNEVGKGSNGNEIIGVGQVEEGVWRGITDADELWKFHTEN